MAGGRASWWLTPGRPQVDTGLQHGRPRLAAIRWAAAREGQIVPFPFSHSGEIAFAKTGSHRHFARSFLNRLERELTRAKARRIVTTDSELTFSAGMMRPVSSLNRLAMISGGRIEVLGERDVEVVRYRIGFGQLFIASIVLLALLIPDIWSQSDVPGAQRLGLVAGLWLLLFGANFAIGVTSFRSMIQSAGRYRYAEAPAPELSS